MRLILVTGGARAGKSAYAQRRALELGGDSVTFIATARASDPEMARRIARHRELRPAPWRTLEVPVGAGAAIREADTEVVLLDCLTLLASNALLQAEPDDEQGGAVEQEVEDVLEAASGRAGTLIAVTNEVGLGIVPTTPLGRRYRDALGEANQRLAAAADEVVLLIAGLALPIKREGSEG